MASVKSLGLHPPLGIEGQPVDGKHTWEVVTDEEGEDELLTVGNCVIWKRGGLFRKSFNLEIEKDEPILQALLTRFPTTDADHKGNFSNNKSMGYSGHKGQTGRKRSAHGTTDSEEPQLAKALVVFLKTQAHIYFLSGTSHIVHMPFEVESACAAPVGVIIQRKPRTQNLAPVSLKFPRVPPNSFVSPYISPSRQQNQSTAPSFSVEGLRQPKSVPLRLNATMENMFETPLETSDSHWPRLVCLTDPLLELGLVVSHSPASGPADFRTSTAKSPFLDLAEEILHIETVRDNLTLAVTANREANLYTVWQVAYVKNEDVFTKHQKRRKSKSGRRRSSMQPRISSGATTPILPSFRESLNAQAQAQPPAKRNRKSERREKAKADDIALALGEENEGDKIRRQSRRVSSLLARADLSASHERTTFAEQAIPSSHAESRRMTGARARQSGGPGPLNLSTTHSIGGNLGHLLEAPTPDDLLDELGGFHDMGLDDHSFDGLTREILLTKVHSVAMDNSNVRYSLSNQPARAQSKVFIVDGPPFATDENGNRDLLICIQDKLDKRLQLLPLRIEYQQKPDTSTGDGVRPDGGRVISKITPDVLRRAHNVADSCKVFDGDQAMILILSENTAGQRELSLQAPWSAMSTLTLPLLYADNLGSLEYVGTHVNKEVKGRRSVGAKVSASDITRIRHSRRSGVVDLEDQSGNTHRVQIQLQPKSQQVRNVLRTCQSVLPVEFSEKLLATWWQIVKWFEDQNVESSDLEWSCLVIEILSLFLSLAPDPSVSPSKSAHRRGRSLDPTAGTWEKMNDFTAPNASACPPWMQSHAWRWMLETETPKLASTQSLPGHEDFLTSHIRLAKLFMSSTSGQAAFGPAGYLPTAPSQRPEDRARAAWGIAYALHLMLEEQKLDVMISEYSSLGRANVRVLLCQIYSWLGWHEFVALHELGVQVDISPNNHHGICTTL